MRIQTLLVPLNKKYRELKDNYKKEFKEIDYETEYGSKNIDNLKMTENELKSKMMIAERIWKEEKDKDDKIKSRKNNIDDKLRELNRIRRRLNMTEISDTRFEKMDDKKAENEINDLLEDARMKENEKTRITTGGSGIGAPLRTQGFFNPTNNNNSTTNSLLNNTNKPNEPPKMNIANEYEGGISALISQSSKGISIRQLLLDQQMKNKVANKNKSFLDNLEPNLGKPVPPTMNTFSLNQNNELLFTPKQMSGIISEPTSTIDRVKIEPKFINTPVDKPEILQTHNMTQIMPRKARENAPLRYKYSNNSITKISNSSNNEGPSTIKTKINPIYFDEEDNEIEKEPIIKEKSTIDKEDISLANLKSSNKRKSSLRYKKTLPKKTN